MLESLEEERDLGVIIGSYVKVAKQCRKVVRTANRAHGMIYRVCT